jgi:hypothetical protein
MEPFSIQSSAFKLREGEWYGQICELRSIVHRVYRIIRQEIGKRSFKTTETEPEQVSYTYYEAEACTSPVP